MKIIVTQKYDSLISMSCRDIEQKLNLAEGVIQEKTLYGDGTAEIKTSLNLTPTQIANIETKYNVKVTVM